MNILRFLFGLTSAGRLEKRLAKARNAMTKLHDKSHVAHANVLHVIEELAAEAKRISDVRDSAAKHIDAGK